MTQISQDAIPLRRINHIRFFVGNASQSACFYRNCFGFDLVAYAGLLAQSTTFDTIPIPRTRSAPGTSAMSLEMSKKGRWTNGSDTTR